MNGRGGGRAFTAENSRSARAYHEDYEGYGKRDARSRLIVSNVTLRGFQSGTPPCHAQFQDLLRGQPSTSAPAVPALSSWPSSPSPAREGARGLGHLRLLLFAPGGDRRHLLQG